MRLSPGPDLIGAQGRFVAGTRPGSHRRPALERGDPRHPAARLSGLCDPVRGLRPDPLCDGGPGRGLRGLVREHDRLSQRGPPEVNDCHAGARAVPPVLGRRSTASPSPTAGRTSRRSGSGWEARFRSSWPWATLRTACAAGWPWPPSTSTWPGSCRSALSNEPPQRDAALPVPRPAPARLLRARPGAGPLLPARLRLALGGVAGGRGPPAGAAQDPAGAGGRATGRPRPGPRGVGQPGRADPEPPGRRLRDRGRSRSRARPDPDLRPEPARRRHGPAGDPLAARGALDIAYSRRPAGRGLLPAGLPPTRSPALAVIRPARRPEFASDAGGVA